MLPGEWWQQASKESENSCGESELPARSSWPKWIHISGRKRKGQKKVACPRLAVSAVQSGLRWCVVVQRAAALRSPGLTHVWVTDSAAQAAQHGGCSSEAIQKKNQLHFFLALNRLDMTADFIVPEVNGECDFAQHGIWSAIYGCMGHLLLSTCQRI